MRIIKLDVEDSIFYCPVTGQQLCDESDSHS